MRFLLLLLLIFSTQAPTTEQPKAVKFDDFGDIQWSDKIARLDHFAIKLQSLPEGTKAFIVVYRSRRDLPGLSSRFANVMKSYLVHSRGVKPDRVIAIDGGKGSYLSQELWIVPTNTAPVPREDVYNSVIEDTDSAREFDDYSLGGYDDHTPEGNSLEAYSDALRKEPLARAYIIFYPMFYVEPWWSIDTKTNKEARGTRIRRDSRVKTNRWMSELKKALVAEYKINPSRVVVVNGGYRQWRAVELWILPRGEHPPVATPNAFPKR